MFQRNKLIIVSLGLVMAGLVFGVSAQAAPLVPCSGLNCTVNDLLKLLVNIYNFLLGLAAMVALFMIIFSGIRMFYFGFVEDSSSELEAAKLGLTRAITGLVIVAVAYLVVNTLVFVLTRKSLTELFNAFRIPGIF